MATAALRFGTGGDENGPLSNAPHRWTMELRKFHVSYAIAALIFKGRRRFTQRLLRPRLAALTWDSQCPRWMTAVPLSVSRLKSSARSGFEGGSSNRDCEYRCRA